MLIGGAVTAPPGDAQDFILDLDLDDLGDGLGVLAGIRPWTGYGDFNYLIQTDLRNGPVKHIEEGGYQTFEGFYDPAKDTHAVTAHCIGDWDDPTDLDLDPAQLDYESDKGKALLFTWDAEIEELEVHGDNGQLSGWSLSGLERFTNCRPVPGNPQHGRIDVELSNSGSTRTLTLSLNGQVLASGSRSGDGSITLAEQNESGLSGSATVAYTANLVLGDAYLEARWARSYELHIALAASWPLSFPRSAELTVYDTGRGNRIAARYLPASIGTWEYLIRAVSDTGVAGTNTGSMGSVVVPGRPEAPGAISLQSTPGNYSNTKIQFAKSATGGVSYRYYASDALDEPLNWYTPIVPASESIGASTVLTTLPAFPNGTGKIRLCVVAVASGVESARQFFTIEYASGAIVLPRPSAPGFRIKSKSGRTVTVEYTYDTAREKGTGYQVRGYLYDEAGVVAVTGSPVSLASGTLVTGTLTLTASGDGWFSVLVKTETFGGLAESENTQRTPPEWLSTAAPGTPANNTAEVVA